MQTEIMHGGDGPRLEICGGKRGRVSRRFWDGARLPRDDLKLSVTSLLSKINQDSLASKDNEYNEKGNGEKKYKGEKRSKKKSGKLREKVVSSDEVRNGTHGLFKPDVQASERV